MSTLFSAILRLSGCGSTAKTPSSQTQWVLLVSLFKWKHSKRRDSTGANAWEEEEGRAFLFPLRSHVSHFSLLFQKQAQVKRGEGWPAKAKEKGRGRESSSPHKNCPLSFFHNNKARLLFSSPQTKRTFCLPSWESLIVPLSSPSLPQNNPHKK